MPSHDCREELRAAGSRATPGRLALLAVLERARCPLTVSELEEKLPDLNEVTLYRAAEALAAAGLLRQGMREGVMQYEYAGRPHHHHMVCTDCGVSAQCRVC
ncbi:MAG: ferric uptake regulator, fur family [Candidatus Adlerbacteria bacterium]|nr:ferric uptake regulator, fur family [Candidatus Adlerbacteria bacterium]